MTVKVRLRLGCGLLRTCFRIIRRNRVQPVHEGHVGTGNQVPINIDRDLNAAVPHLLLHVGERGSSLDEQRSERVAKVMKSDVADTSLGQHRQKVAMVEIIAVEDGALR